ncbi:MAG TPA: nucleotide sugar dehydrogenase, partial [Alphaproteobacteria bacterium]|nr:nucleotide sugar dehydrogenase [Alphaproteobacteria bacterium]
GLGYVGIQLATAFGRNYETIGFDPNETKLDAYRSGIDPSGQVPSTQFQSATSLSVTSNKNDLKGCLIYIVAVPTPVDHERQPDFGPLIDASRTVGEVIEQGAIVVYESTVYPGATEEICVPVLEEISGFRWKIDFHLGYSPERINPGDSEHTLSSITKVVSADDEETLEVITNLYQSILDADVHQASSIRVAEAAKVIENTQRDLNIALVNELAMIFDRLGIDTTEVLEVAGTKWNFLPFRPGLVGGHCIGVDPYYLTHKAKMIGYQPEVILAGRKINDNMGQFVARKVSEEVEKIGIKPAEARVNVLGITFKEDCVDIRNSQVFAMIRQLERDRFTVKVADPIADQEEVLRLEGLILTPLEDLIPAPVLMLAVSHESYLVQGQELINNLISCPGILIDIKAALRSCDLVPGMRYWSL